MCVIFLFSNQPSDDSSQLSGEVTQIIESVAGFLHINTASFDMHLFIRKAAHFTEFAILGLLLFLAAVAGKPAAGNAAGKAAVRAGLMAQLAGMGYAVFDELHQIFIPGRSCQIKDMLIDSSGVLLAVLLCSVWVSMKVHGRKRVRPGRWNE
jgi:VanZ family protein